jgi:hypothetical protein
MQCTRPAIAVCLRQRLHSGAFEWLSADLLRDCIMLVHKKFKVWVVCTHRRAIRLFSRFDSLAALTFGATTSCSRSANQRKPTLLAERIGIG